MSDMSGHFVLDGVDAGRKYVIQYEKKIFKMCQDTFSTVGKRADNKIFLKKQLERTVITPKPKVAEAPKAVATPSVKQPVMTPATAKQPSSAVKTQVKVAEKSTQTRIESFEETPKMSEKLGKTVDLSKENVKVNLTAVEKTYAGYKIELFTSKKQLEATDPDLKMIAFEIMSIMEVDNLKNNDFSYMVGSFLNWSEAERFLAKVQAKYSKAQIVDYYNGNRIGQ